MIRPLVIAAALVGVAPGCKRGADAGTAGTGTGSGTAASGGACDDLAETVRALYRTEGTGDEQLDAELLEANVHMVLADCATAPERFAPCIRRAASIAGLERDCLLPLDDEGATEGQRFGGQ